MLMIENLRDLIRDRGIAAQNGASDLSLFGATDQTFPQSPLVPDSASLTAVDPAQEISSGSSLGPASSDLTDSLFGSGGFWASLLGLLPAAPPIGGF